MDNTKSPYKNRHRSGSKVSIATFESFQDHSYNSHLLDFPHQTHIATDMTDDFIHVEHETNPEAIKDQNKYIQTVETARQYYQTKQTIIKTAQIGIQILQHLE